MATPQSDTPLSPLRTVAVVGLGTMGTGIAEVLAAAAPLLAQIAPHQAPAVAVRNGDEPRRVTADGDLVSAVVAEARAEAESDPEALVAVVAADPATDCVQAASLLLTLADAAPPIPVPAQLKACDSGTVWPRKGPKRAGVITFRFGEVVPAGLKREEAEARVHAAMNALDG